jgi:BCCT family betaine/carnitine transporter
VSGDRADMRVLSLSVLLGVAGPLLLFPDSSSTMIVALPLIPVLTVLSWSLLRWLKADFSHLKDSQHLIASQPPER